MDVTEREIDRWLDRGGRFLRTAARNPVVRATLEARGLNTEELGRGWQLYAKLHGFGNESAARRATPETGAAQAINEIDNWDAPAYAAARAVLDAHAPDAGRYLFDNLAPATGSQAVAGARLFLERVTQLRSGTAPDVEPESGRRAVELLATRKILDTKREAELTKLIETAERGALASEVVPEVVLDPERARVAQDFIAWLHEWREVARMAVARRDYRISLGLAQRRRNGNAEEPAVDANLTTAPGTPGDQPG